MYVETKGMKRSLPCMDLISAYVHSEVDQSPSLRLMDNNRIKCWDDHSSLAPSAKKLCVRPAEQDTPATQALEKFLRFAMDETAAPPLLPIMDDDLFLFERLWMRLPNSIQVFLTHLQIQEPLSLPVHDVYFRDPLHPIFQASHCRINLRYCTNNIRRMIDGDCSWVTVLFLCWLLLVSFLSVL